MTEIDIQKDSETVLGSKKKEQSAEEIALIKARNKEYYEILERLMKEFPETFSKTEPKVLKKGIHKDIKERTDLSPLTIKKFLTRYCRLRGYKEAHQVGAVRYNLDGKAAGEVTQGDIENIERLKEEFRKSKAKQKPKEKQVVEEKT